MDLTGGSLLTLLYIQETSISYLLRMEVLVHMRCVRYFLL